ncbi:MAG: glycoside hydrolase family 3 C-terminal domain-containing protein [Cytophagales bacterium]|nr:glycoside hydrolase family 3 C-terminal domain-containing protein [Cytophagales bacterium]MDW8384669.1 glycoside hydrolase family 3 N-terminal domain-containing protein [Flammeovirgaceae bacterium]
MKNKILLITNVIIVWGFLTSFETKFGQTTTPSYQNENSPSKRALQLLRKMSLEQKIGQMTQICFSTITLDGTKTLHISPDKFREAIVKWQVGSFLSGTGSAEQWIDFLTEVQRIALEETELKIPLLIGIDHVHGANYVDEGTILPHNLTLSCSFDTALAARLAEITAIETADLGLQWNFTPVLDVGKNPYWPRFYETFGEDPLVCAEMGASIIRAYQNSSSIEPYRLAACAKHFIGYSDPRNGFDRSSSEIPEQILYEIFVPPFQKAFQSGVKTVMINSGDLNGEPLHSSKRYLYDLLRNQLGFDGVVVTDIKDIQKIVEMHAGAATFKEAVLMSIQAGVDMYMACNSYDFISTMLELVKEGKISEDRINRSVYRILKLKYELGLFENPYPRKDRLMRIGSVAHKQIATDAARESIVLLKNENLLPLSTKTKNILVAGKAANSKHYLAGAWTYEWMGQPDESKHPKEMETILEALQKEFPNSKVEYVPNAEINLKLLEQKSRASDVIILTVGEKPYSEFKGNINNLLLDSQEQTMIETAAKAGKPIVLVLVEGRPRIISHLSSKAKAILFAGHPGFGGGRAIAEIIRGSVNPSGKLSFSYPCDVHSYEPYYRKFSSNYWRQYTKLCSEEFPFGHGLSYATFQYENLTISDTVMFSSDTLIASVTVRNLSDRDGKETVLWYIQDEVGSIVRPIKMLKGFEKRLIRASSAQVFHFQITAKELSFPDEKGRHLLEEGYFTLMVGNQKIRFKLLQ